MASSTVRNFLNGKLVDYATFVGICQKLSLEWQDFADSGEVAKYDQELEAAVAASETELSSKPIVLDQSQPSHPLSDKKEKTLEASHKIEPISFLEYFSKAIDQLKSKELDVRIGAISTLGTLSEYSPPAEHWKIMEYLASFIRTNAPRREEGEEERSPEIPEDIQAALTVIGQRDSKKDPQNLRLDLSKTDIRGALLTEANLQGAILSKANLQGAYLKNAKLQGADLNEANLQRAKLWGADLQKAKLWRANLERAVLNGAELQGAIFDYACLEMAYLWYVNLQEAKLRNTKLKGAILREADLQGAILDGADLKGAFLNGANLERVFLDVAYLEGANLSEAKNLKSLQLETAFGDSQTLLPDDVEAPARWQQSGE